MPNKATAGKLRLELMCVSFEDDLRCMRAHLRCVADLEMNS